MCWRIVASEAGWKIFGSVSLVIRRVFEGGAGEIRPGIEERSMDSGERDRLADNEPGDDAPETGGETRRPSVWRGGSCVATDMSLESCGVAIEAECCSCSCCCCRSLVSWISEGCKLAMVAKDFYIVKDRADSANRHWQCNKNCS